MDIGSHSPWPSTEKSIGQPFLVIGERDWNNRGLMVYGKPKSPILELIEHYRLLGHSTFRKNTNTQSGFQSILRSYENRFTAFCVTSINQDTSTFIKETKQRNLSQLFLANKHEWILYRHKHEHNVGHRCMVGNEHIATANLWHLSPEDLVAKAHTYQDELGPKTRQLEKERIPLLSRNGNKENRKQCNDRKSNQYVEPNTVQCPENVLEYYHALQN